MLNILLLERLDLASIQHFNNFNIFNMKKIFYSSIFLLFALTSCEDYLDVNDDQTNRADFDKIAPNQMLAGALNGYTNLQVGTLSSYGNRMSYVWGLNSGFTTTDPAYTYVYDSNSYIANFESTYLVADNFQDILDKKELFPGYEYHYGIAKIFKVMCMDYATALYGDVPYTEAFNEKITSPKYDDDKSIIKKLFAELDEAKVLLSTPDTDATALGTEDIVFKGSVANWKKFANTIELKLLLRLSKTTDASLVALRNSRFANLNSNQNFISSDVTVNPGYNLAAFGQRTPIFRLYGLNEGLSDFTSANLANAAGKYAGDLVNGTINNANITSGIVDPRRSRMFTSLVAGGPVVGNEQGVFPLTAISKFSAFFTGRINSFDGPDSRGDRNNNAAERNAFLMLAAESKFLQAEAFQRGYLTGDAEQAFKDGIVASFSFFSTPFGGLNSTNTTDLPARDPIPYIAAIDSKNGLGWTGSTDKISAIMTQKYLALMQWHGMELYLDHLRTGFPVLPLPTGVNNTNRPNRLIYPSSEYSSNSANVPNITNAELFTVNAKTPYYLQ